MTREELVSRLFDQLEDETEDVYEYHKLCEVAKTHGMHSLARGLKMIAKDEYSHAEYLAKVLGEEADQPKDAAEIWHKWHKMLADVKSK